MGQGEILKFLEKQKEPLALGEIYLALEDINPRAIRKHIQRLLKHSEIKCIEIDRFEAQKRYKGRGFARRMLLYYV